MKVNGVTDVRWIWRCPWPSFCIDRTISNSSANGINSNWQCKTVPRNQYIFNGDAYLAFRFNNMYIPRRIWHTPHRCSTRMRAQWLNNIYIVYRAHDQQESHTHKSLWSVVGQSTDSHSMASVAFMFLYTICAITLDRYSPLILNLALWQSMHMFHLRIVCGACNRRDCEKIPARVELRKVTSR